MRLNNRPKSFILKTLDAFIKRHNYQISENLYSEFVDLLTGCSECEYKYQTIEKNFLHSVIKYQPELVDVRNVYREIHKIGRSQTLAKNILMFGETEGRIRWKSYCEKQSITNKFEYKAEKYGMTIEDFDEYNKSRSVTLELMIKRHGEVVGTEKFNAYVEKQRHAGCSLEYFQEKYGPVDGAEFYATLNRSKAQTLENIIAKHGVVDGTARYLKWRESIVDRLKPMYSNVSQEFFRLLDIEVNGEFESYYGSKNTELAYYSHDYDRAFIYDYAIPDKKLFVEFNGDLYHATPTKYSPDYVFDGYPWYGLTAKEVWQRDIDKTDFANRILNYTVVTVWEHEYRENPTECVNRCLKELWNT